ncbi:GTPase HflX [Candidatus Sumerlaeota bacterium]|nr:GTPase HflX [Candidatus Sumerlaeota bacterium]
MAEAHEHLEELKELVATMGVPIMGSQMVNLLMPSPKYFVGSGKAEMIKQEALAQEANLIIIDDELTPAQQNNWEKLFGEAVIDRREVILDIFKQRARSREAVLQVELARLEYSLPRLKRMWTHLERQRGGAGFVGGAGEAQIEVDRRIVRNNIAQCKRELEAVRSQRATQRKARQGKPVPVAAIVGYTNSGKSTLLNTLTNAGVLAENKLFATLDPTTRRMVLPNNQEVLLTDTVGFIRKLPHMLVDAFKATLEESQQADFLIHVLDASHPAVLDHLAATEAVLEELGASHKPTVYVLNKMDLAVDEIALAELRSRLRPNVPTSMVTGRGLEELKLVLSDFTGTKLQPIVVRVPAARSDVSSFLYREGHVLNQRFDGDDNVLEVALDTKFHSRVAQFIEKGAVVE